MSIKIPPLIQRLGASVKGAPVDTLVSHYRNKGEQERNPDYSPRGETVALFTGRLFAGLIKEAEFTYSPFLELIASIVGKILVAPPLCYFFKQPLSLDRSYAVLDSCVDCFGEIVKRQVEEALVPYCKGSEKKKMMIKEVTVLLVLLAAYYLRNRLEQKRNPSFNALSHTIYQTSYQVVLVVACRALSVWLPRRYQKDSQDPTDLKEKTLHTRKWVGACFLLSPILCGLFERQRGLSPLNLTYTSSSAIFSLGHCLQLYLVASKRDLA